MPGAQAGVSGLLGCPTIQGRWAIWGQEGQAPRTAPRLGSFTKVFPRGHVEPQPADSQVHDQVLGSGRSLAFLPLCLALLGSAWPGPVAFDRLAPPGAVHL